MEPQQVLHMLEQVASGSVSPVDAQRSLADQGYSDLGFAKVDTDRARRTGAGEVVYGAGKTADQIAGICLALRDAGQACVLVTRLEAQKAEAVRAALLACDRQAAAAFEYRPVPQLGLLGVPAKPTRDSYIAVACAGTSDLYCAEEAAATAEVLGLRVVRLYDVEVAGIHRLLAHRGGNRRRQLRSGRGGHGGRACQCGRRDGRVPRDRRSRVGGLRCQLGRRGGSSGYAQFVHVGRFRGQHRQRVRRGISGTYDRACGQPAWRRRT